jgi:TolB protein
MKRTLFGTTLLAALLAAGSFWAGSPDAVAQASVHQSGAPAEGGFRLTRLAIPADGKLGDILRKNARISAGFEVVDRKSLPADLVRATEFDPAAWSAVGVDAVIIADDSGAQTRFKLYDLSKGAKPVLVKGYPKDPLDASNRFMNDVIEFYTQEPGVFGSKIAFVRTRRNPTTSKNVQTVQMNGEAAAGITSNRSLNILPSISPGGEVLFTSYAKRNPDLWMSSGGAPVRVSQYPGLNLGGAMSPDGGAIAVALSKDGNAEIYKLGRDGSVQARLTTNPSIDGSPTWSPAGQIGFVSNRAGGPQIFRMGAGGGAATRVTKQGDYNSSPDWNHGKERGQWLIYSGRDGSNRYAIFKVDVKSGKRVPLSTSPGRNLDPTWSPDGRLFAYIRDGGLFIATEEGDNHIEIAKGGSMPDWGPRAN